MRAKEIYNDVMTALVLIVVIAIGVGIGVPLGNMLIQPKIEEVKEDSRLGGSKPSDLTDLVGIYPTTTSITQNNTDFYATSTPTTTSYISIGRNVDQINLFIIARATTTEDKSLLFSVEVSPNPAGDVSTNNYFALGTTVSTGVNKVWTSATTTNSFTLPNAGYHNLSIPICNSNYDGTDNIPNCIEGSYKIDIGRIGFTNADVYAGIKTQ